MQLLKAPFINVPCQLWLYSCIVIEIAFAPVDTRTHTHAHTHTHTHTHSRMHRHTHAQTHTCTCSHTHMHTEFEALPQVNPASVHRTLGYVMQLHVSLPLSLLPPCLTRVLPSRGLVFPLFPWCLTLVYPAFIGTCVPLHPPSLQSPPEKMYCT